MRFMIIEVDVRVEVAPLNWTDGELSYYTPNRYKWPIKTLFAVQGNLRPSDLLIGRFAEVGVGAIAPTHSAVKSAEAKGYGSDWKELAIFLHLFALPDGGEIMTYPLSAFVQHRMPKQARDQLITKSVSLTPKQWLAAQRVGQGNVSAGVRRAVENIVRPDLHSTKLVRAVTGMDIEGNPVDVIDLADGRVLVVNEGGDIDIFNSEAEFWSALGN